LKRLQTSRAADGATHSLKDSVEANGGRSSAKVLTKYAVLSVSGFQRAPRPGMFRILGRHKWMRHILGVSWLEFLILDKGLERKEKKNYTSSKKAPHIYLGKWATWKKSPFTRKEKGGPTC